MTHKHFPLDDSPQFQWLELDEVTSTNDFLHSYRPVEERRITLVTAEYQTAGRGSGQNHWESERGKNILFSLLVHPRHIPPERMFVLSEVLALAIRDAVHSFTLHPSPFILKWPNDIYHGDKKLCGMLIENDLRGDSIERSVMGVGINVNQITFESDAPNPVSLAQILGHEMERRFVLECVIENFSRYYGWTEQGSLDEIHQMYLSHLYRKDEKHHFIDKNGPFLGTITDVEPSGHLIIIDEMGKNRRYAFKEVAYLV